LAAIADIPDRPRNAIKPRAGTTVFRGPSDFDANIKPMPQVTLYTTPTINIKYAMDLS
jgi:hypothetical protein